MDDKKQGERADPADKQQAARLPHMFRTRIDFRYQQKQDGEDDPQKRHADQDMIAR